MHHVISCTYSFCGCFRDGAEGKKERAGGGGGGLSRCTKTLLPHEGAGGQCSALRCSTLLCFAALLYTACFALHPWGLSYSRSIVPALRQKHGITRKKLDKYDANVLLRIWLVVSLKITKKITSVAALLSTCWTKPLSCPV